MSGANPWRGEIAIALPTGPVVLRPDFASLVAAEQEIGPLFRFVEQASEGTLAVSDMVALFWHCLHQPDERLTRACFADAVIAAGLSCTAPVLKHLIGQILQGR